MASAENHRSTVVRPPSLPLEGIAEFKDKHKTNSGFRNPWPSYHEYTGTLALFSAMAWKKQTMVPVPENPLERPVQVIKPDFTKFNSSKLTATWIGHASWFLRFPSIGQTEGLTVLFDPLFSERSSPTTFMGPKRYEQTPCSIQELPFADVIAISHNHYDHCDLQALSDLWKKQKSDNRATHFFIPSGNKTWFLANLPGLTEESISELDWWEGRDIISGEQRLTLHCTPAQHTTARSLFDKNKTLWCSWTMQHTVQNKRTAAFFAGDTAYRTCPPDLCQPLGAISPFPGVEQLKGLPVNPSYKHIGQQLGGVDVAFLPIGLFNPISVSSKYHCSPWDAVEIHKDLQSRASIGMHFGTIRGGLSQAYEPIDLPTKELKAACEREGIPHAKLSGQNLKVENGAFDYVNIGSSVEIDPQSL